MMRKLGLMVLIALTIVSCSKQEEMIHVDVDKSMNTFLSKNLSDVVKTLEYVSLETDSNSLVPGKFKVALFERDIAMIGNRKILLFDRTNGKFKKEVLHWGNNPGGYANALVGKGMHFNEKEGYIFVKEWGNYIATYCVYTGERKQFPLKGVVKSVAYTDDDSFVVTAFNFDGKHQVKMWMYDNYQCVDSIPNHWTFNLINDGMTIIDNDEIFYRFNDRTYFKDATNDTVFAVTDMLKPAFIFTPSSSLPQIELRERPELLYKKIIEKYFVNNIMEDASCIYFTIAHEDKIYRLVYDKLSNEGGVLKEGFINDIDGGVNLFPDHITERGEYVFVLNPASMSEEELAKSKLNFDDNPMIIIGRK